MMRTLGSRFGWWALAGCLTLFLAGLGGYGLLTPDEPRFGLIVQEMLEDGDWVVLHLQHQVYSNKPPLFHWLVGLLSLPMGRVSEWSARLPSALAATGTVLLTWSLGRRLISERAGQLAAAVLATTGFFFIRARWASTDMTLTFFFTLALYMAARATAAGEGVRRGPALGFFLAAALATMTKGPVGLVLPAGILVLTLAAGGRYRDLLRWPWLSGMALYVLLVAPWYIAFGLGSGGDTAGTMVFTENVTRFFSAWNNQQPPTYYLHRFPLSMLPWSAFFPVAAIALWRLRRNLDPGARLALIWVAVTLIFFTISSGKRTVYMLPAFPAAALLLGWTFDRGWPSPETGGRRWTRACGLALAALLGLLALSAWLMLGRFLPGGGTAVRSVLSALSAVAAVAVARAAWNADPRRLAWTVAAASGSMALISALWLLPTLDGFHNVRGLSAEVVKKVPQGARFATGHRKRESFLFYTGLFGPQLVEPGELRDFLQASGPALALVEEPLWQSLQSAGMEGAEVLLEAPVSDYRYVLVGNGEAGKGGPGT